MYNLRTAPGGPAQRFLGWKHLLPSDCFNFQHQWLRALGPEGAAAPALPDSCSSRCDGEMAGEEVRGGFPSGSVVKNLPAMQEPQEMRV